MEMAREESQDRELRRQRLRLDRIRNQQDDDDESDEDLNGLSDMDSYDSDDRESFTDEEWFPTFDYMAKFGSQYYFLSKIHHRSLWRSVKRWEFSRLPAAYTGLQYTDVRSQEVLDAQISLSIREYYASRAVQQPSEPVLHAVTERRRRNRFLGWYGQSPLARKDGDGAVAMRIWKFLW